MTKAFTLTLINNRPWVAVSETVWTYTNGVTVFFKTAAQAGEKGESLKHSEANGVDDYRVDEVDLPDGHVMKASGH